LPKEELESYTTSVGSIGETWMFDPYGKSGGHTAQITVFLTPYTMRKRNVSQIIDDLKEKTKDIKGFDKFYFEKQQGGPPVGKALAVKIRGEKFAVLEEISTEMIEFLENIEGVVDITSDYEVGRGEVRVGS